jgi:hypothetical protein
MCVLWLLSKAFEGRSRGREAEKSSKGLFFKYFSVSSVNSVAKDFDNTKDRRRGGEMIAVFTDIV